VHTHEKTNYTFMHSECGNELSWIALKMFSQGFGLGVFLVWFPVWFGFMIRTALWKNTSEVRLWWLMPIILATWETEFERTVVQGQPWANNFWGPISKIRRPKWTGDVPQVEEGLLFKSMVLSSNPIPSPSIKKEKEKCNWMKKSNTN
jgi:hypothetical protein